MSERTEQTGLVPFLLPIILALVLFAPLFAFRRIGPFDFWWWMGLDVVLAVIFGFLYDRPYGRILGDDLRSSLGRKIFLGVLSAGVLYGIFFAGNVVSRHLLPFAGPGIDGVYGFKQGASVLRIGLLMGLIIGPGEELFWRGYLQRQWEKRFGSLPGFFASTLLYALIHAASGNLMLVLAAGVCGLFWGALYRKYQSVVLVVVSHTVWDLMVFLLLPFID